MKLSLYHSPWCPFCVRVVNALKHMSVDVELRDTSDREHMMALRQGGGKTQVPCLLIEASGKSQWMYESDDIIDYLKSL
ncbi:MAG: glutaredoxin family protein [Arenicella sp.]